MAVELSDGDGVGADVIVGIGAVAVIGAGIVGGVIGDTTGAGEVVCAIMNGLSLSSCVIMMFPFLILTCIL